MAHLAKDTAVRAGDALDGQHRAVRVVTHVHRRAAGQVHILRCDLTSFDQLVQQLFVADKAAFAVADGDQMLIIDVAAAQPWALVAGNAGTHQHALMAMNRVEGQRRVLLRDGTDLAVGDKAQLDECLKAVADT